MDDRFVVAVETSFRRGLESRAAARSTATVRQRLTVEQAIQAAWIWYCRNRDAADIPFAAVVARVRARCPGVKPECIRAGFERRFRRSTPLPQVLGGGGGGAGGSLA